MTLKTIVRAVTPRTRWQAALVSAIVVGSLTAGVSYASTPDSSGVIHACYNNKSGALKVMDTAKTPQCPKGTTSLVWNQTGPPGPVASCAGIPHIGIDLNGCDLEGANLNGDNLTDANFGNADLTDAVLSNAALTGTNLGGTTLTGVQSGYITGSPSALPSGWFLTAIVPGPFGSEYGGYLVGPGANLSDAILTDQNLGGVNLTGATLTGVGSGGITGTPAALPPQWNLISGYLLGPGTNLASANLSGLSLSNLNLTGSYIEYANLTNANLSNDNLTNANFQGSTLTGANLTGVTWSNTTCPNGTVTNSGC